MKYLITLFIVINSFPITEVHKYYLSVTDLKYNQESKSIQIITRLFYDDLEDVLQERYDNTLTVSKEENQERLDEVIEKYLKRKLIVKVNREQKELNFLGKELEDDYVVCYLEIEDVQKINELSIENTLLMDLFEDQKNMLHTNIQGQKKSLLLEQGNAKALLKFK